MTDTPLFSVEQVKDDGRARIAKTGGQVGGATALVTAIQGILQARHLLHGEMAPVVFGSWVTLTTIAAAALTNLSKLRGRQ
jgi:hypothetical protein